MRVALVLAFAGWIGCETRLGNMQQADPVCGVRVPRPAESALGVPLRSEILLVQVSFDDPTGILRLSFGPSEVKSVFLQSEPKDDRRIKPGGLEEQSGRTEGAGPHRRGVAEPSRR